MVKTKAAAAADGTDTAEGSAKRQKIASTTMYLVVLHESYSSGDPLQPKVVGLYNTKDMALEHAKTTFERHSYYFENGKFNEEASQKLEEFQDNSVTMGAAVGNPDGKVYFEASFEGDELTVSLTAIDTDKPWSKKPPTISIY